MLHTMLEATDCARWWLYLMPITYSRTHIRFVHRKSLIYYSTVLFESRGFLSVTRPDLFDNAKARFEK
jgi:hypothetical protein